MEREGSITVFSALCLMLVSSFLFALLEAGRIYGLNVRADCVSVLGGESVCAEYQPKLWEEYHLLCLDGAYGGEEFSVGKVTQNLTQRIDDNLSAVDSGGTDIFSMQLTGAACTDYQLITDGGGDVFIQQILFLMKESLPADAAALLHKDYLKSEETEKTAETKNHVEAAEQAIREAEESRAAEGKETPDTVKPEGKENPLEVVLELKRNAVLGLVVNNVSELSEKENNIENALWRRTLEEGTQTQEQGTGWYDKVLLLEYLERYFSDYTNPAQKNAFAYEAEYVLCGRSSDKENLEKTAERLLLLREAANVTHILGDTKKRREAELTAEMLAGFTGNPAVIKQAELGVVAAWAYLEGIQDVRTLLEGGKIALIKKPEQWTIDTGNLLESFQNTGKAKNCEDGLDYQDYLKRILFITGTKKLAYRMMDVIERNIRLTPPYGSFQMDHMICRMTYSINYKANPLFSRMSVLGIEKSKRYSFSQIKSFSYG